MNIDDLTDLIAGGEDSFTQFKENLQDARRLAEELVAFSNAEGGQLIIGVSDDHQIKGLSPEDLHRLHQLISNTANENVKPPIYPLVQQFQVEEKLLLLVQVRKGSARPYATSSGVYLTKSGADKRRISPEELRPLFAESGGLSAEESLLTGSSLRDLNPESLQEFLRKRDLQVYEDLKAGRLDLNTICENLDLIRTGMLTLAGNLLFGREPQRFKSPSMCSLFISMGMPLEPSAFYPKTIFTERYLPSTSKPLISYEVTFADPKPARVSMSRAHSKFRKHAWWKY